MLHTEIIVNYGELDTAAEDTLSILESYIADMTGIIAPDIRGQKMVVDQADIYGNLLTMEEKIGHLPTIDWFARVSAWETYTVFPDSRTRRKEESYYKRVQDVKNSLIMSYGRRIGAVYAQMQDIYRNEVTAYVDMDNAYAAVTEANYQKHTDRWKIMYDDLERFRTGVSDFVVGFVDGVVDVFVGLYEAVDGVMNLLVAGTIWGVCDKWGLDKPDWASGTVETAGNTATQLLHDPLLMAEGISQCASDAVEQKGICYCGGYLTGSIMADKGIEKGITALRSMRLTGTTGKTGVSGKTAFQGMNHTDDLTRAGVGSMDNLDDLARATDAVDGVRDAAVPSMNPLDEVGKRAADDLDSLDDLGKLESRGTVGRGGKHTLPNVEDLKMSQTVRNHMNDVIKKGPNAGQLSRPYIDSDGTTLLLKEIMESADPVSDTVLQSGLRWDISGTFRGSTGTWELVVDTSTNTVVHFNFVAQ